jgi:hypothetical protein
MNQEQADFALSPILTMLALPTLTESADNRICYRTPLRTTGCTPDPIEAITGTIADYATAAKPTISQCYDLLTGQWPFVTYWFDRLFSTFEGPSPVSYQFLNWIKTILQIWILHFGPGDIDTWTDIKEAMNDAGENWVNHIAWIDSSAGFSLDAGATVKNFPEKLLAWLQSSCPGGTATCYEVLVPFNYQSTVCANAICSASVKAYCLQVTSNSACATS